MFGRFRRYLSSIAENVWTSPVALQQQETGWGPSSTISSEATAKKWQLVPVGDCWCKIVAMYSGKCLEVAGGVAATGDGVQVQQYDYGSDNQKWRLVPVDDGWYKVIAKHSGKCLDVVGGPAATENGVGLQQYDYRGGDNQKWQLISWEHA